MALPNEREIYASLTIFKRDEFYHGVSVDTPTTALISLTRVLSFGIHKHGPFKPENFTRQHFMEKHDRHLARILLGQTIDESGEPHLIHAAADLLLAWECETESRKHGR